MPLLSPEERKNVINYKYHGGDSSPVYKYVLSPIAQFGVDYFTPVWMAPNVVTLLGLLVSATATVLTLIYNPTLSLEGPRWLHAFAGVSIFLYQTLDNMDGKQARKTGSSSALGMLFDHGCDAINAGLSALNMASVLGTGWTYKMFFPLTCGFVPFYFQTWEEYYLGAMILPVFNGPTEGLIMCMIVCFFSALKGSIWFQQAPIELPSYLLLESELLTSLHLPSTVNRYFTPLHIAMLMGYGTTFVTMFVQIGKVLSTLVSQGKSVVDPVVNLLPFFVFFPSIFYWCTYSEVAYVVHPILTYVFVNMVFVELIVHLMLMHICKGKLTPFDKLGPYVTGIFPLYITFKPANASPVIEAAMIFICAAYFSVNTITYLGTICTEIAKILNIFIFKLGKRSFD